MPCHIKLNKFLGFGKFRYMTGAQVLQHQDGLAYMRWAHHSGIVLQGEILFQLGLHPSQTNPTGKSGAAPLTPELLAEAQAHENQLNGEHHEKANRTNVEPCKPCSRCGYLGDIHDDDKCSERESDGGYWGLYC